MVVLTETKITPAENQVNHYYSPEEYLALEEKAETKHEYHNGEILEMAGATLNHNKIALNFCRLFPLKIQNKNYEIFMSDVKLYIPKYNVYTYPDVMIVADNPLYQENSKTTILNPSVIVEVLSLSTQSYDRGQKFRYYRSVDSLQDYIIIDQYECAIEQFTKNSEQKWVLTESKNLEESLNLESLSWQIPLKDIYQRVDFASEEKIPTEEEVKAEEVKTVN